MALVGAFRRTLLRAQAALATKPKPKSAREEIDWKEMDRCFEHWPPDVKSELMKFKSQLEGTIERVESMFVEEDYKINWDEHYKRLPAPIVDIFKKEFEEYKPPQWVHEEREEFVQKFKELEEEAIKADQEIAAMRVKIQEELKKNAEFRARLPTMTVDEVLAERPDLKEIIDDEIRNNNWDPNPPDRKLPPQAFPIS